MIILYTQEEFDAAKSKDLLTLQCELCSKAFLLAKGKINEALNPKARRTGAFCSAICNGAYKKSLRVSFPCSVCGTITTIARSDAELGRGRLCSTTCQAIRDKKKAAVSCVCKQCGLVFSRRKSAVCYENTFCTNKCICIYNNQHRKRGGSRSKIELWLEEQLTQQYLDLDILYNRRDIIGSELDIYVPSLKKAIEINGIFHYEPIFGEDQCKYVQSNDKKKVLACIEHDIELLVIDISAMRYFIPKNAQVFLDQICAFIDQSLVTIK